MKCLCVFINEMMHCNFPSIHVIFRAQPTDTLTSAKQAAPSDHYNLPPHHHCLVQIFLLQV